MANDILALWFAERGHRSEGHGCVYCGMTMQGFRENDAVCHRVPSTPKPATAEPPTWKGRPSDIGTWPVQWISIAEAKGRYPAPDPIAEFNERRKAKREKASDIAKAWEHAGHVWSPLAHACVNCGYSEQTLVATQHLPLCADQRQINARDKVFARAMLTPITFTARLGGRT